jgi:hypothetical protein
VAVSVIVAPAKRTPKSGKSPIFRFFYMGCKSTQSLIHLPEHYRV